MTELNLFIPITKIDEEKRLVYGTVTEEVMDKSGEVFDYDSSKPYFEAWSGDISKATAGKSKGNLRVMHGTKAAGKLTDLNMDDQAKRITCVAKVVDDDEWKKCLEGVYTGFSQGGKYVRRWTDDDGVRRYTANPSEVSIVDNPCLGTAHFELVKSDGMSEQREFRKVEESMTTYSPPSEDIKKLAQEMADAAGKPDRRNDYVVKAREKLIADHEAAPAAEADPEVEAVVEKAADPEATAETIEKADPVETLNALLDGALNKGQAPTQSEEKPSPVTEGLADTAKALAEFAGGLQLSKANPVAESVLNKGLCTVAWLARLLDELACLQSCAAWEEEAEGDGSPVPAQLAQSVQSLGATLLAMAQEEVAELVSDIKSVGGEVIVADEFAMAAKCVASVIVNEDLMAKAGARNSKTDQAHVQAAHDHAAAAGAMCNPDNCPEPEKDDTNADSEKAALLADRERLSKALADVTPKVEQLLAKHAEEREADRDALAKALGRIEALEAQPMPSLVAKSSFAARDRSEDAKGPETAKPQVAPEDVAKALAALPEQDRVHLLMKAAMSQPIAVR